MIIHEFICRETGETVDVPVDIDQEVPSKVKTPSGKWAYKNYGASAVVIPAHHRAGSEEAATYDAGKRAMSGPHKNSFKEQAKNARAK